MLDIKNIEGKVVFSTPINIGCKRKYTLMQEDYISLVFSVAEPIYFRLGDSIYDGQFEITDLVSPKYNDTTAGYDYEVKFDKYYWKWKNKKFFYTEQAREASWSLTANLDTQLSIVIKNLEFLNYRYKGKAFEFSVDSTVKNVSKPLRYDNLNIIEALNLMAQTWECEWWVTDNIIHLGRCEYGTPVDFKLNDNVEKMSKSEGKQTFATRIYAFGSERNIPKNYRPTDSVTVNGVVQKRLMLPVGTPYIDAYEGMTNEEAVEQVVIFDEVYPKLISKVSKVESKEGKDEVGKIWTYFISDDSLKFDKKYILPDTELRLVFQSGKLNGLDFALSFANNKFEIIRNEDYGRLLPDDILKPEIGDEFILHGYDTTFVSDALLPKAEQELKEKAILFTEKSKIDPSTYECSMMSDYMLNGGNPRTFEVGDRVRLINKAYFKDSRVSRIIGYEYPLDMPYDSPIYIVGETASYSHLEEIKADVKELTYKEKTFSGSGSNVYVIGQYDSTPPTDRNVLSSQKSLNAFHRKDQTDSTDYLQKFNKGIEVGGFIDSMSHGRGANIDEHGNAQFESIASRSSIITQEFIFNRLQANESDSVYTESGVIESVNEIEENTFLVHFKKRWETDFIAFHKDDILRGVVNTLAESGAYYTSYVRVLDVNTSSNQATILVYPDSEVPAQKNYPPAELMIMHRWGNVTDTERQTTWFTSSREGRMVFLQGVNKPILNDNNYGSFWGLPIGLKVLEHLPINPQHPYLMARGIIYQDALKIDRDWNIVPEVIDKLDWKADTYYSDGSKEPYEIHEVWHNGCKWRCIVDGTIQEPKWNATDWVLISGDSRLSMALDSTNGTVFRAGFVDTAFIARVYFGNTDITDDIAATDWEWLRESSNPYSDMAWISEHNSATNRVDITDADVVGLKTKFICRAFVRYGDQIIKTEDFKTI